MKIIATSDGKVCFKEEGYISHELGTTGHPMALRENEMKICHKDFKDGYQYLTFSNAADAKRASKEISEQLKK